MSLIHIDAGREWRGGQRQSFFLVKELQKKGFPVFFVVQPGSPLQKKAVQGGISVVPLKIRNEFDLFAIIRLAILMKQKKCKLVHFHDAHSVAVGSLAASMAKIPLRIISRRVDFPLRKNIFSRKKYRKDIDAIIAISNGVKNVLIKGGINSSKIKVIPSGIDFSPYMKPSSQSYLHDELSFKKKDYIVGIVAHLADHKGHKYLLNAAKLLREQAPGIKIVIVGKGPLEMKLKKQSKNSHIDDIVYFLGYRDDIPRILRSLDLFVLSSYLEGMGSTILDAMACQLPVVATCVGGIPEVVIHNKTGLLVSPRNPSALAKAILKLYKDRKFARQLGRNGFKIVYDNYSAEVMALRAIDLYKKIARKKGIELDGAN
ncbi:MAG: glycosyltransferase [Candidatus Aminicenantaceae bacterium]